MNGRSNGREGAKKVFGSNHYSAFAASEQWPRSNSSTPISRLENDQTFTSIKQDEVAS